MTALLVPIALAIGASMLFTRSLTAWAREPVRWWPLAALAIGADLILARIPVANIPWLAEYGHWLWTLTLIAIAAVLVQNARTRAGWRRAPWLIAAIGAGLNVMVVLANGGYMPVDSDALESTGMLAQLEHRPAYRRDVPIDAETRFSAFADIYADPGWLPPGGVLSLGDLILVAGLVSALLATASAAPRRRFALS